MAVQILNNTTDTTIMDISNSCNTFYIKDECVKIKSYNRSLDITFLENSLKTGVKCSTVSITCPNQYSCDVINFIYSLCGTDLKDLIETIRNTKFEWKHPYFSETIRFDFEDTTIEIRETREKGVSTFSPFATPTKLKKQPKKWTKTNVAKMLLNKQFVTCIEDSCYNGQSGMVENTDVDMSDNIRMVVERVMTGNLKFYVGSKGVVSCYNGAISYKIQPNI